MTDLATFLQCDLFDQYPTTTLIRLLQVVFLAYDRISTLRMPTRRSEPIHFGIRFGAQEGISFRNPFKRKWSLHPRPPGISKYTDGGDSVTGTICSGYAPSRTGRTTVLCDETAPLLGDARTLSEIAPGTMVICDGPPQYAESDRCIKRRSSSFSRDRLASDLASSKRPSSSASSTQSPHSCIESWATDVRAQPTKSPRLGARPTDSFPSGRSATADDVASSREALKKSRGNSGYRSPFVS